MIDQTLLQQALTHKSYANEHHDTEHYQRLEILGDAVLQLVVTEYLYFSYPDESEGEITKRRAGAVSTAALAARAETLMIDSQIRTGKGVQITDKIRADVIESIIAAIYLSNGLSAAKEYVLKHILTADTPIIDSKTDLQEAYPAAKIEYKTEQLEDERFSCIVFIDNTAAGSGSGHNKKAAEKAAAAAALSCFKTQKY